MNGWVGRSWGERLRTGFPVRLDEENDGSSKAVGAGDLDVCH